MKNPLRISAAALMVAGMALSGLAWAEEGASKAAEPAKSEEMMPAGDKAMSGMPMMHMGMEHRAKLEKMMKDGTESVEKAIQTLDDAKSSDDVAKLKGAMDDALKSLRETQMCMEKCNEMMTSGTKMMGKMGEMREKKAEMKAEMKEKKAEKDKK